MSSRAWALVAAAAVAVLALRKPIATAGGAVVGAFTGGENPTAKVIAFARAIASAEGFGVRGAIPTVRNNPGDLKFDGMIATYATAAEGWRALYRQLELIVSGRSKVYTLDMTIREMGDRYAPPVDRNVPGEWAGNVARALGVPVTTRLRGLLT